MPGKDSDNSQEGANIITNGEIVVLALPNTEVRGTDKNSGDVK